MRERRKLKRQNNDDTMNKLNAHKQRERECER